MKKLGISLILAGISFCGGCEYGGIVSLLGTPSYHENKIPAEYNLAEHTDQRILVFVKQPQWLGAEANLRPDLTEAINKNLVRSLQFPVENLVRYSKLSQFRSEHAEFSLLSPAEVGRVLDVDMVLVVVVEDYQVNQMTEPGYFRGWLNTQAVLIETARGTKLWPKDARSKSIKVGFELEQRGQNVAVKRLAVASAYCTTRYFYDCQKKRFRIPDDRSTVSWEGWGQ